jgi:hypothetical protein
VLVCNHSIIISLPFLMKVVSALSISSLSLMNLVLEE